MTNTTHSSSVGGGAGDGPHGGRWIAALLSGGGITVLVAQLDGAARTVGILLVILAVVALVGAEALARVLAVLPAVLRELPPLLGRRARGTNGGEAPGPESAPPGGDVCRAPICHEAGKPGDL